MHCTLVVLVDPAQSDTCRGPIVVTSRLYQRKRHGRIDVITVDDSVVQRTRNVRPV